MAGRIELIGIDNQGTKSIRAEANLLALLRAQARQHEHNRLESVAETVVLVAILVHKKVLTGHEAVAIRGAVYQFDRGTQANHTQAAHCLPGHLTFNTLSLHDLGDWSTKRLQERGLKPIPLDAKLRNLGGRTDVTDSRVNQADSYLERMSDTRGLAYLFSRAVENLVKQPTLTRATDWKPIRETVTAAFNHYRTSASLICQQRSDDLTPKLNSSDPTERQKAQEMAAVISEYLQVIRRGINPASLGTGEFAVLVSDVVTT